MSEVPNQTKGSFITSEDQSTNDGNVPKTIPATRDAVELEVRRLTEKARRVAAATPSDVTKICEVRGSRAKRRLTKTRGLKNVGLECQRGSSV